MLFEVCFLGVFSMLLTSGAPVFDKTAMEYLINFGYLNPKFMELTSQISPEEAARIFEAAIIDFQNFVGLEPTGNMDESVQKAMKQPRCGEKDKVQPGDVPSHENSGDLWTKRDLTFTIHKYTDDKSISEAAIDEDISLAFLAWSNVTNLDFRLVSGNADIHISFYKGEHGDSHPFDGRGMILAHAKKAELGKIHFDDDEPWTIRRTDGIGQNLFLVAVHEIGHILGLNHSNVRSSIMHGMLTRGYEPDFMLHDEDITRIQNFYQERKNYPPDLCADSSFDAIFENPNGIVYILKGQYFWKLSSDGIMNAYPRLIKHHWPGLPDNIDAAIATSSGRTYFFKNDMYWAYDYRIPLPKHPKLISEGWPGIPNNIDAAAWYTRSSFYFFKGDQYWLYDSYQTPNVNSSYPKLMTDWGNIAGTLDDVLYKRNGQIYFFTEGVYYRYNCKTKLDYLVQFGYLDPKVIKDDSQLPLNMMENMANGALMQFQRFVGLKLTGKMDKETNEMMLRPRCGLKDKYDYNEEANREKKFAIFGEPWSKLNLTYTIYKYPSDENLLMRAIDEEIERAFSVWAKVTKLTFQVAPEDQQADINITFSSGNHGDKCPFDGRGMVIAHAFLGEIHFDDEEKWTTRKREGQDLFHIAVHEVGHVLGLDHSTYNQQVMYPYVQPYNSKFELHSDDIEGIQFLYGKNEYHPPDLCLDSSFDAIFKDSNGVLFVLKDDYYWKIGIDGSYSGYPQLISHHWPGLPGKIDAALTHPSEVIYFFKDDKFWVYNDTTLVSEYPKNMSDEWPGIESNIDAALWYENDTFFFFKGDYYWEFKTHSEPMVFPSNPKKLLLNWDGILGELDDVIRIGNFIYFFRKGYYYRFNCETWLVDLGWPNEPNYPRPTGSWWFRCMEEAATETRSSGAFGDLCNCEDDTGEPLGGDIKNCKGGSLKSSVLVFGFFILLEFLLKML